MPFQGKIVWITGASSGIGADLAVELASKGAILVLSARRKEQLDVVRMRCQRPEEHFILPLDVTDFSTHQAKFDALLERFPRVDVIIVNAGIGQRSSIMKSDFETERQIMDVNFFGCTSLTRVVLPHFLARNQGQIAVISSIMGFVSTPRRATYAASKHALHGYYEGLRSELHKTGVSISMVCPGYVNTEISIHSLTSKKLAFGHMDDQHLKAMPADVFVKKAVRGLSRRKPVILIGGLERFAPLLARLSPALLRFLIPRVITSD
jgi:dehydrogenase/reductase SDR family member 7B